MANQCMNAAKCVFYACKDVCYGAWNFISPFKEKKKQHDLELGDADNLNCALPGRGKILNDYDIAENITDSVKREEIRCEPQQTQSKLKGDIYHAIVTEGAEKKKKGKKKKKESQNQSKQKLDSRKLLQSPVKECPQDDTGRSQDDNSNLSEPKCSSRDALCGISKTYFIVVACALCSSPGKNHKKLEYRADFDHNCTRKYILMKYRQLQKKGNIGEKAQWYEIRPKPLIFKKHRSSALCEGFKTGEKCEKEVCPYPHNDIELDLWKRELRTVNPINLCDFLQDLKNSTLADELQEYNEKSTNLCTDKSETLQSNPNVQCKSDNFRNVQETDDKKNMEKDRQNKHRLNDEVIDHMDLSAANPEKEEPTKDKRKGKKKKKDRRIKHGPRDLRNELNDHIDLSVASPEKEKPTKEIHEADIASPKDTNPLTWKPWDGRTSYELEVPVSNESESIADQNDGSNLEPDSYYQIISEPECTVNAYTNPEEYKYCIIYLDGTDQAKCQPIDTEDNVRDIEIRGRHNCGTAFDLDEVLVQILTPESSTETAESKRYVGIDNKDTVTRGRVVRVLKHSCVRKSYTFLCTVDAYHSHLMIPLCGKVPKLHVKNKDAEEKVNSKSVVAVYNRNGMHIVKIIDLTATTRNKLLFVVKYIQWRSQFMYPYGFVVHVVEPSSNLECQQYLLNIFYQIPTKHSHETLKQIENDFPDDNIPKQLKKGRKDMTRLLTFTIDPEECQTMDDALSINKLDDGSFEVFVHIAHVAQFVDKDSPLDKEAQQRGETFDPVVEGIKMKMNMLPEKLSKQLCSLEPGQDRLAISFSFKFGKDGELISKTPDIKISNIHSNHKLTYQTAQNILDGGTDDFDNMRDKLQWLKLITKQLCKSRAGKYHLFQKFNEDAHDAHMIVEELMLLTNRSVARIIKKNFLEGVPLRKQDPPHEISLIEWNEETGGIAQHSLYFDRYKDNFRFQTPPERNVIMLRGVWQEMTKNQSHGQTLKYLFGLEDLHPTHAISMHRWISIQKRAIFVCHEDKSPTKSSHFALKMEEYVQCTSPIRRYMDLVVQRILLASLNNQKAPYSNEALEKQCEYTNMISDKSREFRRHCHQMKSAHKNHVTPQLYPIIVISMKDGTIKVLVPHLRKKMLDIKFGHLKVITNPIKEAHPSKGVFVWEKRLYCNKDKVPRNARAMQGKAPVKLNPNANVILLNPNCLLTIHDLMDSDKEEEFVKETQKLLKKTNFSEEVDVTSETKKGKQPQGCQFELSLQSGSVLQAQIGADLEDGLLQSSIRLLRLTPTLDVCIQHAKDPVTSFAKQAELKMKRSYTDMEGYQEIVLPILQMEAATSVITDADPMLISNVSVFLEIAKGQYCGEFKLSTDFCKTRQIPLQENASLSKDSFLCIRCQQRSPTDEKLLLGLSIWVGHAATTNAKIDEGFLIQHFQINHMSELPPEGLFRTGGKNGSDKGLECTIELLMKPLPHRRMEQAVCKLSRSSELCQNIVRGKPMVTTYKKTALKNEDEKFDIPGLPNNNVLQTEAIKRALENTFTVIQGPPGTGKTMTGVKIAYWLTEHNKKKTAQNKKKNQILYCGPSNNSVDVAAKTMQQRLGDKCPKIIRVYSEAIEYLDYPIPRETSGTSKKSEKDLPHKKNIMPVALHHLVRQPPNSHRDKLLEYDEIFKKNIYNPDNVEDDIIVEYKKILMKAAIEELERYDIIFCTCSASASGKMVKGANIKQIIIDECGMCKEPESLVPMVAHGKADQIILIGDHKQLRPIVRNRSVVSLGLNISLFERHQKKAIMLTHQYRMHQIICKFPSRQFYHDKLITENKQDRSDLKIWRQPNVPIMFCHVEGVENSQSVTTAEANQASKSNKREVEHACRICKELIDRHGVKENQISILSQYKAQVSEIKKQLKQVNVSTVVASQGDEWDYVILSCVRSLPKYELDANHSDGWLKKKLGFINDPHQINVAITRAKKGLIIIGNKNLLKLDKMWCNLLAFYEEKNSVVPASEFPPRR